MAEYNMTYEELKDFLEECIKKSESRINLSQYNAEILTALTVNVDINNSSEVNDMLSLWENQIGHPSELLLKTRYIPIKDTLLSFLEIACTTGLMDILISGNLREGMTIAIASGVIFSLVKTFTSVSELSDFDFCIYMQATCHFRRNKSFTKSDLLEWFPHGDNLICNMHNSNWDCEHIENDKCTIISMGDLDRALDSLIGKELLKKIPHKNEDTYKFVY